MSFKTPVTKFTDCIVRRPASSVTEGLRAIDVGAPNFLNVQTEQKDYIAAMEAAGVKVDILPALEDFPDSIFVEDPALTFPNGAILLRPGAPSRRMETQYIALARAMAGASLLAGLCGLRRDGGIAKLRCADQLSCRSMSQAVRSQIGQLSGSA